MDNPLNQFKELWAVDYEFAAHPGEKQTPVCLSAIELRSGRQVLQWQDEFGCKPPYDVSSDSLIIAYFASAELGCHRALGWPQPARVLDLFCEFKNHTNGLRVPNGRGLLGALTYHGLNAIDVTEKTEMRDLVLRGGPWSWEEREAILQYCRSDTDALARLLPRMMPYIDFPRALLRGRYMSAVSGMEYTGTPIDAELHHRLLENWELIQEKLIADVDSAYGIYEGRSFRTHLFAEWLVKNGLGWPRLDSGRLDLEDETFEAMSEIYPEVSNLRKLRQALGELRLCDLSVGADGYNRCLLSPFASKTSRNQPSNTHYIFGPGSWMRSLIKPKEGQGVAYLDWEQQEFGIAAGLSRDAKMWHAYESGDPYLAFAKQAKAVPEDATKESHGEKRELFKRCILGMQYGIGEESLARRIERPFYEARELLRLHREVYKDFWRWSDNSVDYAVLNSNQQTVFGWTNYITPDFNSRSIRNFYMQANGAEMLRLACCFGMENNISVCAPVHDALLILSPLETLDQDVVSMQEYMKQASRVVLDGYTLRTEHVKVRYPNRYVDKKVESLKFWNRVIALLPTKD